MHMQVQRCVSGWRTRSRPGTVTYTHPFDGFNSLRNSCTRLDTQYSRAPAPELSLNP